MRQAFGLSRAQDDRALAFDAEQPLAGHRARRTPRLHVIWAIGGSGEVLTGKFVVTYSRQAAGMGTQAQATREAQVEGTCRQVEKRLFGCATEDVVEDAGRAEGGCSARQPPGVGWVWDRVLSEQLAVSRQHLQASTLLQAVLLHAAELGALTEVPLARPSNSGGPDCERRRLSKGVLVHSR